MVYILVEFGVPKLWPGVKRVVGVCLVWDPTLYVFFVSSIINDLIGMMS